MRTLKRTVLVLLLAGLSCRKGTSGGSTNKQPSQNSETGSSAGEPGSIQNRRDKLSYAFGVDMAHTIQQQKERLNVELLRGALLDALDGKKLMMSDDEVSSTLKTFEAELRQDFQHAKKMITERNKKEGEAFFAENAKKEGVVTLPTGLQYKILTKGNGKVPTADDVVVCNYRGTLLDGKEIDSSSKRPEPPALPVKGMIPGFAQALQLMPVGSKWQLFVPPHLAYGERAMPNFGPNSTLIFDVELVSIKNKAETATAAK
jgi:FKBP-type peptidyl-prolyl cis-trans isomerase